MSNGESELDQASRPSRTDRALAMLLVVSADFASTMLLAGACWVSDAMFFDIQSKGGQMPELTTLVFGIFGHAADHGALILWGLQALTLAACLAITRGAWPRVRAIRDLSLAVVLLTLGLSALVITAAALPYTPIMGRIR